MLGWKELASSVETAYNLLPKNSQTVVLCDSYGQSGTINYYTKNRNIRAVSFNDDYINWFNFEKKTDNVIRVKEFHSSADELQKTSPFFSKSFIAGTITNPLAREYKTTVFVFIRAKIDINQRLKEEIEKERWH